MIEYEQISDDILDLFLWCRNQYKTIEEIYDPYIKRWANDEDATNWYGRGLKALKRALFIDKPEIEIWKIRKNLVDHFYDYCFNNLAFSAYLLLNRFSDRSNTVQEFANRLLELEIKLVFLLLAGNFCVSNSITIANLVTDIGRREKVYKDDYKMLRTCYSVIITYKHGDETFTQSFENDFAYEKTSFMPKPMQDSNHGVAFLKALQHFKLF